MVLAQEEAARVHQEKQVHQSKKMNTGHVLTIFIRSQELKHIWRKTPNIPRLLLIFRLLPLPLLYFSSFLYIPPFLWPPLLSQFFYLCFFFLLFSLRYTPQKHSLKPMHESHLAHLKWSKVRVYVTSISHSGGNNNSSTAQFSVQVVVVFILECMAVWWCCYLRPLWFFCSVVYLVFAYK